MSPPWRYLSFVPWKFCGESGDEVEDAPAEDDGVVDVVHVTADQHAVAQAAEDGEKVALQVLPISGHQFSETHKINIAEHC